MQETKKIIIHLSVGYAGMDTNEGWEIPTSMTEEELDDFCWDRACDHAESYGYYPPNDEDQEGEDDDCDAYCGDKISNHIEGSWQDYDEKKHAGKISYGTGGPYFNTL